jgi:transposase
MEIALKSQVIFIANKPIDFRKSIDGLCALVAEMQKDPGSGVYIFYNKNMNRIKILGWHRNGFTLIYKRLDAGKFFLHIKDNNFEINSEQLNWLLVGVDWKLLSGGNECKNEAYF